MGSVPEARRNQRKNRQETPPSVPQTAEEPSVLARLRGDIAVLPKPLQVLVIMSNVIGVIGLIIAAVAYGTYTPDHVGDAAMKMSIPATGVMVGLYFLMFVVFSWLIVRNRTMGFSGLVLTNITLVIISWTMSQAHQWALAGFVFVFSITSLVLLFNPNSMNWYKQAYAAR